MIDGRNFFEKPVKNDFRRYGNFQKIAIGQGDDYANYLLDYPFSKILLN